MLKWQRAPVYSTRRRCKQPPTEFALQFSEAIVEAKARNLRWDGRRIGEQPRLVVRFELDKAVAARARAKPSVHVQADGSPPPSVLGYWKDKRPSNPQSIAKWPVSQPAAWPDIAAMKAGSPDL